MDYTIISSSAARDIAALMKRKTPPTKTFKGNPKRTKTNPTTVVRYVKSTEEQKEANLNAANTVVFNSTAGVINNVVGIAQGNTPTTRSGRRVMVTSMKCMWQGSYAPTTTGTASLRALLVYDKQANAASPAATDILLSDNIYSPMNLNNSRRFKIIRDWEVPCTGTAGPQSWFIKDYIDFTKNGKAGLGIEMNNGNGGNVTDIISGSFTLLTYQSGSLLIASPVNNFHIRTRFTDS